MENYQIRKKIHPKQRVAVLLKEDYENGNLTYGTVDEILTKTETHYRGIKVKIKIENETDEDVCLDYSNNYNREIGKKCGFVSPFGASVTSDYAYADWVSFVAWILTEDRTERETDMKTWSRLQEKYDLVIQYYRQYYQLDLEQLAEQCQKLTVK